MIKRLVFMLVLLSAFSFQLSACYAEPISSKDLIERAKELDGKEITYKGEAVTAILKRGEHSWVNLNDGNSAIGIWCKTADLKSVIFIGDYRTKGDILEARGTFNRACRSHSGEMDIHARSIKIVEKGHVVAEHLNERKIVLSAILFLIVISLTFIFKRRI